MKRLTLILALTACLGPVGASADTILVPDKGRSGIPGVHSDTWDGGTFYMRRIENGGNDRSHLGDDLAADVPTLSTWHGVMSMMVDFSAPGQPSVALPADALILPFREAGDLNTNVNDPRTLEWSPVVESTKAGGWAWAWAWGRENFNSHVIGREHPPGAAGGPEVVVPAAMNEPAALVLVGTGLILLARTARRRRRS